MAFALSRRRIIALVLATATLALMVWAFLPRPLPVDAAVVARGPLEVTTDEDAETRAIDRFLISAPVAGRLARIELQEGDPVHKDQVIARLWPVPLSAREREEQLARITAAEAQAREANEHVRHALADHDQAVRELGRVENLVQSGFIAAQGAEQARTAENTTGSELEAARHRASSAAADAQAARAALLSMEEGKGSRSPAVLIRSPAEGKVLHIPEKSERIIGAGAPLMTVGDPARLEVVIDLLSTEAVKVMPGMPVLLEDWGGDHPLRARVRVVEPQAFTKVSALGVEEQRVNVIADFIDGPAALSDGFRVNARILLWKADDVIKLPVSALYRQGENWCVFVIDGGRARQRQVTIGHRGALDVEALAGIKTGERIIRHPSNDIREGRRVQIVGG